MSVEVVQLTGAEFDEAMEFLDGVFGEHRPHDFATLLPSIYQPTDEDMACNHAVREDGVLRAVVGLFPIDWQVGDRTLKVGGIGGVSTHPSVRGKGYMQLLMKHCVEKMREEDYHLSWLGGQRQRYGYFGYEKCGQSLSVELSPVNLQHASPTVPDLRFEPIEAEDADRIATVQRLHDAQPVRCRRKGPEFHRFLRSWYRRPHAAVDAAGALVGYLVATEDGDGVVELVATDDDTAFDLAVAWVAGREAAASFDLPPTRTSRPTTDGRGRVRQPALVGELADLRLGGDDGGPAPGAP
jgi:predicted N-acetyltransferase YhbS